MNTRPTVPYTILAGYRGSHAHGTNIDPAEDAEFGTDDIDLMHVVVLPPDYYIGLDTHGFGQGTQEIVDGPWDIVAYDVRKFINLLIKGNPNVLSLLWLDSYVEGTASGLPNRRETFTHTRAAITSHIGYAQGQLNAMRKDPTNRAYMGERRRALAQRFGYDVKHASHMIRLMRMLVDLLRTGRLIVNRTGIDADELVAIKRGTWPVEEVLAHMESLMVEARALEMECDWPDRVDRDWASRLCTEIVGREWQRRGETP